MDTPNGKRQLTRRRVLKTGATALGGGALAIGSGAAGGAAQAQAPAIATGTQTGRTFRGLVRHDATLDVQEMRLLPIDPRQVVIRSLAVAPCYTIVRGALATNAIRRAEVPNHCGFGVVEAIGPMVKRVQVGDRVVVAGHLAVRPVLPVSARPTGLLPVHVLLQRAGRGAVRAVRAVPRRHAGVRAGGHRRHERDHDRLRGVLRAGLHRPAGGAAHALGDQLASGLPPVTRTWCFSQGPTWWSSVPGRWDWAPSRPRG
jgi:hypothetical protein